FTKSKNLQVLHTSVPLLLKACVQSLILFRFIQDVVLVKAGGPLGLSIIGGTDHPCHPFGAEEPGVFISKIVPDGAAGHCARLRVGDRLLKVNGVDVTKVSHQEAVLALLDPSYQVVLTVRHDPLPVGWQ
ncbi:unnamed protein product, partial [Ixodes pacificus]